METKFVVDVMKENAVLACLLYDPQLIYSTDLRKENFLNRHTHDIFCVLQHIAFKKNPKDLPDFSPLNIVRQAEILGVKNIKAEILTDLRSAIGAEGIVEPRYFENYVSDLREETTRARLWGASEDIRVLAEDRTRHVQDILPIAENKVISVEAELSGQEEPVHIEMDGDEDLLECKNRAELGLDIGIHTGYPAFDKAIGGLKPGTLTVVGARSKTGKSLFGINAVRNILERYGDDCPILYLDTEMSRTEQRHRLWSIVSGVAEKKIEAGDLDALEEDKVDRAREWTKKIPFYHKYCPEFTPEYLIHIARKWRNMKGIRLLIFDYIKAPDGFDNRSIAEWQMLGVLTNALKNKIAGTLNMSVLSFCQLNREGISQAIAGEARESAVGGSDRIVHFCNTFSILRKANEEEMKGRITAEMPAWRRYGKYANRYLHICNTRGGGDDSDPIPLYLQKHCCRLIESGEVRLYEGAEPLSKAIDRQFAEHPVPSVETQA